MLVFRRRNRPFLDSSYGVRFAAEARSSRDASIDVYERSRSYHEGVPAGKMETSTTKPLQTQDDLSLAYSPGVAGPCLDIADDRSNMYRYTNKGQMVAVVSNGTAVLGLGNIGAYAAKPVMEGKAALLKTFAGVDAVDICVDEQDPDRLAQIISAIAPSFGAINLEDIKAPDCFFVEDYCRQHTDIPVFHDDQHGTATVVLAAMINAMEITRRKAKNLKLVVSGAGAAALATLDLLQASGLRRENVWLFDSQGLVTKGRKKLDKRKGVYAQDASASTSMGEALRGADAFLGVSKAGVLDPAWIDGMALEPIIFALANPEPEVWPQHVREVRSNAVIATGRSDFPNQVNNVLCFPFLFRGVLDARAKTISVGMLVAAAHAIAELARTPPGAEVVESYPGDTFDFGPEYILPKPFDRRLREMVPTAVIAAAEREGLART